MGRRVADNVDDLTPSYLSEALGREVLEATAERVGAGQTGATYRLSLDVEGRPTTLIAKLAAGDESARRQVSRGYRNEVGFYEHLLDTVDVRAPQCFYTAITDDALDFTLLLEDLTPRIPGVQADGCSVGPAEAAVRNVAGLHAPRWNDPSLQSIDFITGPTSEAAAFLGDVTISATDKFVERYHDALDPVDVETLRASAVRIESWALARPEPFALIHGDYRLDNLMFGPGGSDVVAVDWQTLAVGPPMRDVAYFLGTSLTVEDRRSSEERLVAAYLAALVEQGVIGYSAEHCLTDYRLGQLQAPMITTLGCIYAPVERSDRADAMFLAMARRSCAAIRDLQSFDLL